MKPIALLTATFALLVLCSSGYAHDWQTIEEDWEMVVGAPDTNSNGPQVAVAFAPFGNIDGLHATFELNHASEPDFQTGGLNLQFWNGETYMATRSWPSTNLLSTTGETVTWTQRLGTDNGLLVFEIVNGNSTTWGSFGGQGNLKASFVPGLEDLNSYDPNVSIQNSGVTFAGNRVQSLKLKRVRATDENGDVHTFDIDQTVHQHDPDEVITQ